MNKEIEELKADGFIGFVSVAELRKSLNAVPEQRGVYVVLRMTDSAPTFLKVGTGGYFKGKDPNVEVSKLLSKWVDGSPLLYIGKAGGPGTDATLHSRIRQYIQFGEGKPVGHKGGRYIWQLADAADLVFAWKPLPDEIPLEVEKRMIREYKILHGMKFPFANLRE